MIHHKSTTYLSAVVAAILQVIAVSSGAQADTPTQEMSNTVETLCPALKKAFTANPAALTSSQQDVLFRCGELKLAPGQSFSDLSGDQLTGLNNMTNDESSSMGTSTVELSGAQSVALVGRLATLRSKSVVSVASISPLPSSQYRRDSGQVEDSFDRASFPAAYQPIVSQSSSTEENYVRSEFVGLDGGFSQMVDYGKWGVFLTGAFGTGDKDATQREPGFEFDSLSLVSGVDYRFSDELIFGIALSYGTTDSSIDNSGGDVDLNGFGASLYGTYYVNEFYFDFIAGYAGKEFETVRNVGYSVAAKGGGTTVVNQVFNGDTDADDLGVSVGAGYNLSFGGFGVTPYGQLNYLNSDIDGYTESLQGINNSPGFGLALEVDDQEIKSLTTNVGVQLVRPVNTSSGVLTPYLRADWEHEFENDARNINARFAAVGGANSLNSIIIPTDDPDRDFINLGLGLSAVFPGGIQAFIDYSTLLALDNVTLHMISTGFRLEF